jgi:hypothetical protein
MTKVVLDKRARAQFHDLKETLQFVDESGQLLGLFTPSANSALLKPQISEEEIKKRVAQGGGRPLAGILRDLEIMKWTVVYLPAAEQELAAL